MEAEAKGRKFRDTTSDQNKAKVCTSNTKNILKPTFKKVQVVYYLSRNGQLEHPHYMEVTHLAHQQLRLKDVMERLTLLRGKGMPSLYSWSCKRSYKNGYVWNDLSENDVISASEGAEYVLKGSELIERSTEKFQQQIHFSNRSQVLVPDHNHSKRTTPRPENDNNKSIIRYEYENDVEENIADDHEDMFKRRSFTRPMAPQHSQCSRGVSTEELVREETTRKNHKITVLTLDNNSSPPSTTSSTASDKATNEGNINTSKRFELDGESPVGRNSVLLQLISCGSTSFRSKPIPLIKDQSPPATSARKSGASDLLKAATCKAAIGSKVVGSEEEVMIRCMSENPRFGQAEEKEYFSGSIVETMEEERDEGEPSRALMKRSSSFSEEMNKKAELCGAEVDLPKRDKDVVKGKCIPTIITPHLQKNPINDQPNGSLLGLE